MFDLQLTGQQCGGYYTQDYCKQKTDMMALVHDDQFKFQRTSKIQRKPPATHRS